MSTINEYTTLYSPSELRKAAEEGMVAVDGYDVSELILRALEGMVESDVLERLEERIDEARQEGYDDGWFNACEYMAGEGL